MKRIIAAIVAAILAVIGLVVGASTATAQPTVSIDLVIGDEGTLIGRGAVATVPVEITCSFSGGDFQFADGLAGLRQVQGRTIVGAQGGVSLSAEDCDGTTHVAEYTFFPDAPFRPGIAVISGSVTLCVVDPATGQQTCTSDAEGPKEIRLTK
jgi:type 1 fimbria pilin